MLVGLHVRFELSSNDISPLKDAKEVFPKQVYKLGYVIAVHETITVLSDKTGVGLRIRYSAIDIFCEVAKSEFLPPASIEIDIVKDHTSAWIELAASEDTWQQRIVNIDVA